MSDDDCDIFSIPTKRENGLPKQMFIQETETSETEFSFIETKPALKKAAKGTKPKKALNDKSNTKTEKKATKKTKDINSEEQALSTRELSPISKLIQDMEQKQSENLPVARRTRSSLGKRDPPEPEKSQNAIVSPSPPPTKQKTRGRPKKATAPAQAPAPTQAPAPAQDPAAAPAPLEVEIIDLVQPRRKRPQGPPVFEAFVNLDSDEEKKPASPQPTDFEDENPEVDISLSWHGEVEIYKLRRHQKFLHMFKEISERHNVPIEDIVVSRDEQFIQQTDSPESVGVKVYHVLSGCVVKSNNNKLNTREEDTKKSRKFQLKVQADKWKKPLIISMKKTEPFKILYIKCAEELECDVKDVKLFFDGELLELDDTPKNQEMEGDEIIDFKMK